MAKFVNVEPKFVITRNNKFAKMTSNGVEWIAERELANRYPSRYSAKRHVKQFNELKYEIMELE